MAGAAGNMTLAPTTRASPRHNGEPLVAWWPMQVIYVRSVAALARICAAIEPSRSETLLHLAAGAWAVAFVKFGVCLVRRCSTAAGYR
jgi:uncharacterized protein involved in response to NO